MDIIYNFLNDLRHEGGAIWLEGVVLRLTTPTKFQTDENKVFIAENKSRIMDILKDNDILSRYSFLDKVVLRMKGVTAYSLSAAQERLWFIEQFEQGTNAYHIPVVFELGEMTSVSALQYALRQIVERHEVLRSTIEQGEDRQGIQVVHTDPLPIEEVTLAEGDNYESLITEDINRPFDLSSEYPVRVKFYRIPSDPEERIVLMVNVHHIASDGWSSEIFQRELFLYYEAYERNDTG
ncbi:hypothetical protein J2X69_005087, partial [Algoriphagus sp. 4150]|uniref:condensation domain-containing protein n=1 Tax=Algoriphagus sp. 4150 TaxID=2817756 RepID=UPI002865E7BD